MPRHTIGRIDLAGLTVPPVFRWLAQVGEVAPDEMLRAFNCGIGMVVVCAPEHAETVADAFADAGEEVVHLGCIEPGEGKAHVVYDGTLAVDAPL